MVMVLFNGVTDQNMMVNLKIIILVVKENIHGLIITILIKYLL